jgi:hypothetical protein
LPHFEPGACDTKTYVVVLVLKGIERGEDTTVVLLNYRAEADGVVVEEVIRKLVAAVPAPVAK